MTNPDRPVLTTAKEKKDRSILTAVVACFLVAVVVGIGLSFYTARHADQAAVNSGSSTSPDAPNTTLQDQATKQPPPATTGSGSNVPPASSPR
jgi:hypothetical protein